MWDFVEKVLVFDTVVRSRFVRSLLGFGCGLMCLGGLAIGGCVAAVALLRPNTPATDMRIARPIRVNSRDAEPKRSRDRDDDDSKTVRVKGYERDGKWIEPHERTKPDDDKTNNKSSRSKSRK